MNQNVDYELIPGDSDNWNVRFLEGPFTETVIKIDQLKVSEDEEWLNFNYHLVSSPDGFLSESDPELVQAVKKVLESVLDDALRGLEALNESDKR
jgi:hypothetical protein